MLSIMVIMNASLPFNDYENLVPTVPIDISGETSLACG
jgi:hypothetical protein